MKLQIKNPYSFNHKNINKKFSGGLTFINTFCIKNDYHPVAVYKADKPDKSKGHKKYLLIEIREGGHGLVRGMTEKEMKEERYRAGVHCPRCDDVIFSSYRHDYSTCSCGECSVDGGKDYFKVVGMTGKPVRIDLIKGKVVK